MSFTFAAFVLSSLCLTETTYSSMQYFFQLSCACSSLGQNFSLSQGLKGKREKRVGWWSWEKSKRKKGKLQLSMKAHHLEDPSCTDRPLHFPASSMSDSWLGLTKALSLALWLHFQFMFRSSFTAFLRFSSVAPGRGHQCNHMFDNKYLLSKIQFRFRKMRRRFPRW